MPTDAAPTRTPNRTVRTLRAVLVTACVTVAASAASAQAGAIVSPDDYLVRTTQRWGESSPLGALPARPMSADDVELRVWAGYGLGGAYGAILRRTGGRWQAWRARVVSCVMKLSMPEEDMDSPATDS